MRYDVDTLQTVRETRLLIDEYDSWLIEELKPFLGQRILEVGCGLGNMLMHMIDREFVVGLDVSSETVLEANRKFLEYKNISIYKYSITDPSVLNLKEFSFDSVFSLNVFEHIEDDELAMRHTALLLKPNGYFILIVPAHQWLFGTMDSSIGHYRRYNKTLTRAKLKRAGYRIVEQKYVNIIGALGWFVNGRLLGQKVPPSGQLRMFNKIVPILKMMEHVFPPPFGLSLITVAQRNTEMI